MMKGEKVEYHLRKGRWFKESEEIRVLSGVVYNTWRKVEDREQSLEEHHKKKYARNRNLKSLSHLTRKERGDK